MHGFCGVLGLNIDSFNKEACKKSINLADTMNIDTIVENNFFSAVSFLNKSPLKGERYYTSNDSIFLFAGDLIGYKEIPWVEIESNVQKSNFEWFSTLRGLFAFVIYNKRLKKIALISDHRAQLPVYYGVIKDNFVFSTDLSTFTILETIPEFNVKWLYEYMFFNFPILGTTFLKGVSRNRPITVVNFDLETRTVNVKKYGELLRISKNIKTGKKAIDANIKSFKERIPNYYIDKKTNLVAISGGFDSRSILSLAPVESDVKTYTYGVDNSHDLDTVDSFINKLNIENKKILFNDEFKNSLPDLIYETVRLSGGVQPILRSTMVFVYKSLFEKYKDVPVVLGGINGDFFRGLGFDLLSDASIVPYGMKLFFNNGDTAIDDRRYPIRKEFQSEFNSYIQKRLEKIKTLYGDPKRATTIMSYTVYEENPNYFGGEMSLAENFFTFRQPFWDIDLINMAYKTTVGHLGYVKRRKEKKETTYSKYVFQSKVISINPNFKNTYIKGMPIRLFALNNKAIFKLSRLFIRGFAYIKDFKKTLNNLEEWDDWFEKTLQEEFNKLLNEDSQILNFFDIDILNYAKKTNDIHLLSKMATTEIILNLIKNRWNIK